ncbi:MAG: hypothetical protein DMF58_18085 [Acidobacteria bacterium]|nr:MAG: hypothetical protein DMF58_18085 [Acidobacteriota bacterium]
MTARGRLVFLLISFAVVTPLAAQQTIEQRVQQLEKRLDDLSRQMTEVRQQIDQLKNVPPPAAATEDLTKIETVQPTAATSEQTPTQAPPPNALTDVQTINNVQTPGASKVFNPDISVIGNFLGKAGQVNPYEFGRADMRPTFQLDEAEVAFQAFIDPYAKANFFLSLTPQGIDVEEGYANFITLPYDLTAKVGKMKAYFGKDNTWHTHVRPWVDQPLVIHNFFGDEQFHDDGISVSKIFPNSFAYTEGTVEVFKGEVAGIFGRQKQNDLAYNENSNIELGSSYARGALAGASSGANQFAGIDVTYRWKPLMQGLYKSFIGRLELIGNDRPDVDRKLRGFYASADRQIAQRWFTGVRIDASDRAVVGDSGTRAFTDRGVAATLTFWPSEFSQLRGELRRIHYGDVSRAVNELLFQLQFAIGAHGAHAF